VVAVSNNTFDTLTTFPLMPPHKPLSEEIGTINVFAVSAPGKSPSNL
jgi:hypothetical protein